MAGDTFTFTTDECVGDETRVSVNYENLHNEMAPGGEITVCNGMVKFRVQEIDGHDFDAIEAAFAKARQVKGQPSAIVIKTVKGKGVSYMENDAGWHGKAPNDAEYEQAMTELKAQLAELEA